MNRSPKTLLILLPSLCVTVFLVNARMRESQEARQTERHVIDKALPPAVPNQIISADAAIREYYPQAQLATPTTNPSAGDVMACAWLLVLKNYTSPKQYLASTDRPGPAVQPAPNDAAAWRSLTSSSQSATSPALSPDFFQPPPPAGAASPDWWRESQNSTLPSHTQSEKPEN